VVSEVVEVVIVLVMFVTVSNPGVMSVSCIEKAAPSVTICHLGICSRFGDVHAKLTPPTVCVVSVVAVGLTESRVALML
jgi:hypothetical protein